jgi:hypothetical protein
VYLFEDNVYMKTIIRFNRALVSIIGLLTVVTTTDAFANQTCVPAKIQADDTYGGELSFACDNGDFPIWYRAWRNWTGDGCAPVTADTMRNWHSVLTAALLSGKTIEVRWSMCGSTGQTYRIEEILLRR